ncbi:putative leader peptide [Pseudonocardia hispaniensis]|uniref:Leader peptide n=1 Tax=Pseudonocardia hispaniensis TaxID=904933 RepID=A0ABW1J8J0_9PSEU
MDIDPERHRTNGSAPGGTCPRRSFDPDDEANVRQVTPHPVGWPPAPGDGTLSAVTSWTLRLVARRHVDLQRVTSASCRSAC